MKLPWNGEAVERTESWRKAAIRAQEEEEEQQRRLG